MPVDKLAHFSIRTSALRESCDFYCRVLGFREGFRPAFPFPGAWLYIGDDPVIHLIGVDSEHPAGLANYLGDRPQSQLRGGGAVDHLAFAASDLRSMRERLGAMGVPFRERTVPGLGLQQLFVDDPSGVVIELNFAAGESSDLQRHVGR